MNFAGTFDILSTIAATGSAVLVGTLLSFALSGTANGRIRVGIGLLLWFLTVVTLGATGALDAYSGAGVVGLGAVIIVPLTLLPLAFLAYPPTRAAASALPLAALIAVNIVRVLGVSFILLESAHRLPAPFAPVAGWGDVLVGVTAGPIAWLTLRRAKKARAWVLAWNLVGFVDLLTALALGTTSSPGPVRMFMDPPGTPIMTTLPWIIIPCFLVPSLEAIHVAIFHRLWLSHARSGIWTGAHILSLPRQ
jgi:hypothetical protein